MARDKRLTTRLRAAKLRQQASVEDVDYRAARGLDRALFQKLSTGEWIDAHDNLALVGPAGVGKSWLACAIGHRACRDNRSVLYHRWPKLCGDLALARGDGRHPRLIKALGRADLLILDDFGLEPLDAGPVTTSSKSSRSDMAADRRSSPPSSQCPPGTTSSATPPTPTPSWTASSTTPIASSWPARACAAPAASRPKRLDQKPLKGRNSLGQQARRPGRDHLVKGGRHHPGIPGRNHPF